MLTTTTYFLQGWGKCIDHLEDNGASNMKPIIYIGTKGVANQLAQQTILLKSEREGFGLLCTNALHSQAKWPFGKFSLSLLQDLI
jgi:hypothetical protein